MKLLMKKILGGKEKACGCCGGTVVYLHLKRLGIVSQCKECGSMTDGRVKDEFEIYTYQETNINKAKVVK